jgi:hypothetical protein
MPELKRPMLPDVWLIKLKGLLKMLPRLLPDEMRERGPSSRLKDSK